MRQGYGMPRDAGHKSSGTNPVTIPPMPVGWTPEIIRSLFPIVFSIGRRITFFAGSRSPSLQLLLPGGPKSFPATVQGWVDLWTTVASTVKPSVVPAGPNHVDRVRRSAVATPFRDAEAALAAEINAPLVLGGVVFRGGHGFGEELRVGAVVDIRMAADAILLTSVIDGSTTYSVPAYRLVEVEASGPGAVTSGGFVATVGHGLVGDLTDRYASEWMTDRFGKTTISTLIRLETDSGELFFRSLTDTPKMPRSLFPRSERSRGAGRVARPAHGRRSGCRRQRAVPLLPQVRPTNPTTSSLVSSASRGCMTQGPCRMTSICSPRPNCSPDKHTEHRIQLRRQSHGGTPPASRRFGLRDHIRGTAHTSRS